MLAMLAQVLYKDLQQLCCCTAATHALHVVTAMASYACSVHGCSLVQLYKLLRIRMHAFSMCMLYRCVAPDTHMLRCPKVALRYADATLVCMLRMRKRNLKPKRTPNWISLKELNLYFNIMNVKLCLLNQEKLSQIKHHPKYFLFSVKFRYFFLRTLRA